MQTEKIIEKAKMLGLDTGDSSSMADNLRTIAGQVGLNEFNSIYDVDKLEKILDDKLAEQKQNDDIETLDNGNIESLGEEEPQVDPGKGRFGEREYNQARDKNGKYNKNYYADRGKELDEKVAGAKDEKNKSQKEVLKKDENGNKVPEQKNKNWRDKAKDNINLANAQKDRIQNKINSGKSKLFKATHPVEAAKNELAAKAKSTATNAAKTAAKKTGQVAAKAGKAAGKAAVTGVKALVKLAASNPYVLIAIIALLLLLLILLLLFGGTAAGSDYIGLNGYNYIEPKCTEITITGGNYAGVYDIEEYIAGVTYAEFGGFSTGDKREAAKAGAIAARSYVLANVDDSCTVESSQNFQVYKPPTEETIQIANETRGLVITRSESIISTQYDAFCTDSPQDDPNNYIVCQKEQRIPRSWVDSQVGIANSWKNGTMNGAHGNGMSQWGAAYLAEQEGYTFDAILNYYYDDIELMSIYKSYQISNNWIQEVSTSTSSTISTSILSTPINELLTENEYNNLNSLIYDSVVSAGIGTRNAIVAAAVTPIKYLAENFGVVIPYTLGGGHYMTIKSNATGQNIQKVTTSYYGIDPDWGTKISHSYDGAYYTKYGPDCSSFVPWVYNNAGINLSVDVAGNFVSRGTKYEMDGNYIAQPGDLLENNHHIAVVVGVDDVSQKYYIAHARGGQYGTVITSVSFDSNGYYIVEMSDYIENHKIETYETDYREGVLNY